MTVKIAVGVCTYSDSQGLDRLLASVDGRGKVDKTIIIHGPFPHFGMQDANSWDDTRAVVSKYSDNVLLFDIPGEKHENDRREAYLSMMKDYDFCITLDSDEYISDDANWPLFRKNCHQIADANLRLWIYDLSLEDLHPSQTGPRPRLFHHPSQIKYYKKHYWFQLPNGVIAAGRSDSRKLVQGIKIKHDKSHKSGNRLQAMYDHQRWLLNYDAQFSLTDKQRII